MASMTSDLQMTSQRRRHALTRRRVCPWRPWPPWVPACSPPPGPPCLWGARAARPLPRSVRAAHRRSLWRTEKDMYFTTRRLHGQYMVSSGHNNIRNTEKAVWGPLYFPRLLYWPRPIGLLSVWWPRSELWPEYSLWGVSYFYYPTIHVYAIMMQYFPYLDKRSGMRFWFSQELQHRFFMISPQTDQRMYISIMELLYYTSRKNTICSVICITNILESYNKRNSTQFSYLRFVKYSK